jgi:nitrogen regulatory protein PII
MREVKAVIQPHRLDSVLNALHNIADLPSVVVSRASVTNVAPGFYESVEMSKIELMVPSRLVEEVVAAIEQAAHTGQEGDGRIFVIPIEESIVIRSGERGEDAR